MKLLRLLSCLAALGNMLTGPFLGSSYGTVRLLMPFAAIDTTNCVANSATVWFAAANGDDSNDGKTPQTPKGVYGAAQAAQPGHRICFMGGTYPETGTFYPLRSGTPSAWIVYQAYGDGPVNVVWTPTAMPCPPAGAADCTMVNAIPQSGNSYLEFRGFTFYGRGLAGHAFSCNNSHHLRFIGNTVYNVQGAGVSTVQCDYVVSDHNIVYHSGYSGTTASWTSGISYNQIKAFDCNDGLLNVISNNIAVVRGIVVLTHHDVVGNYVVQSVVAVKRLDLVVGNPASPAGQRPGVSAVIDSVVIAGHVVALNRADPRSLNVEYRVADESQVMRIVAAERVPRLAASVEVQSPEFQVCVSV